MSQSLSALFQYISENDSNHRYFAVDVGAHFGEFSKFLLSSGLFCKVIAFEPNAKSYLKLLDNVKCTSSYEFEPVQRALSSTNGKLSLYCDADTATASLLRYGADYLNNGSVNQHIVPVTTLDTFLDDNSSNSRLLLLKIDTQGNDLAVINGAIHSISTYRPIIQVEFIYIPLYMNQCAPNQLIATLAGLNYELFALDNLHNTLEGRLAFCDAIFIPKEMKIPSSQKFVCINDKQSLMQQIDILNNVCAERLSIIELLDSELRRLNNPRKKRSIVSSVAQKVRAWVR